ncbi:MAG: glycosyltransferase family 2 protein [Clostridia bacterium]|nr:glycosyltransferase family 2 protein [Clostridia bacterium]
MEQIDVLLATYNGEKYLKEQIESILNQTYSNIRLIISDDGSTDNTREIIKEYKQKDKRVVYYFQENNLGYIKNFEFLLTKVENEIYMLSDQDDFWIPEKIEHTYKKLKDTNSDLVFTDLEVVDENLKQIYPSYNDYMHLTRKIKKYINSYRLEYLYNCVTGCTIMSRKKCIAKIIPIPLTSKYAIHDTWIACTIVNNGKVAYLDEKTVKYRQHGNNQVGSNKPTHKFSKMNETREFLLEMRLGIFRTYVENNNIFNENIKKKNQQALSYFEMLKNKKYINFRRWNIFHDIYKTETFYYYISNFLIMNFPCITKGLYIVRFRILKMLGKR